MKRTNGNAQRLPLFRHSDWERHLDWPCLPSRHCLDDQSVAGRAASKNDRTAWFLKPHSFTFLLPVELLLCLSVVCFRPLVAYLVGTGTPLQTRLDENQGSKVT